MFDKRIGNSLDNKLREIGKEKTKTLYESLSQLNEEDINNIKDIFTRNGVTYEIEIYPEESGYIARWEDNTDNGLGYNNRGFVNLSNADLRYAIEKNGVAKPEDYISVISEFDRPLKKDVQREIIRRVLALKNKDKSAKDITESVETYYIKYWKDEESRDQGESDIYERNIDKETAIDTAKRLVDRGNAASVEVIKSPSEEIETEDDVVVFGYDGEETWGDELEESLTEDKKVKFVVTTYGRDLKEFEDKQEAIKYATKKNAQQVETRYNDSDDYEIVWFNDEFKEKNPNIFTIEDMFNSVGVKNVFDKNGYFTPEALKVYDKVGEKFFDNIEEFDKLCDEEKCFKEIEETLKEDYTIKDKTLHHMHDGSLNKDSVVYTVNIFPKEKENGHSLLYVNADNAFDNIYFKTPEEAQKFADKEFPDAYSVMIRKDDWWDEKQGIMTSSGPYMKREQGKWEKIGRKNESLKESNDPYHNHIQYKVTLKDKDGTYTEILEVPEYVKIQDKKFDVKEYFKDFYNLDDEDIVDIEEVGYYSDDSDVNIFKYKESLKEEWAHFSFKSGSNPYIAKTEKEKEKILKKYKNKVKELKPNFYEIDDIREDVFIEENLESQKKISANEFKRFARKNKIELDNIVNNWEEEFGKMTLKDWIELTVNTYKDLNKDLAREKGSKSFIKSNKIEIIEPLERLLNTAQKSLKEEYGAYKDEPYCDEIADRLEDGYWAGYTYNDTEWNLEINGLHRGDFSPRFADYLAEEVAYPVRDGHLAYMGLDIFFNNDNISPTDKDLELLGFNIEDIEDFKAGKDLETWIDYDTNFDVDQWEENQGEDSADWDDEEYYESLKESIDYSTEDYLLKPYWYFTKHGVGVGSIPKSVKAVWGSFETPRGTYFATDTVIPTKDLEEFEIVEKQPRVEEIPEKVRINIQNWLEEPLKEELDNQTIIEIEKELEDILKRNPKEHGFNVDTEEIKDYVKGKLQDKGYEIEISGEDRTNPNKFHIKYFKKGLKESKEELDDSKYDAIMTSANYYFDTFPTKTKYVTDNFKEAKQKAEKLNAELYYFQDNFAHSGKCQVVWTKDYEDKYGNILAKPVVIFVAKGKLKDHAPELVKEILNGKVKNHPYSL